MISIETRIPLLKTLTLTDVGILERSGTVPVEERLTAITLLSHGIVLTVLANATRNISRSCVDGLVEVTSAGVVVAVTSYIL